LWKPRYRASEASELLRALNQQSQRRPHEPSPPAFKKDGRAGARLALGVTVCNARERAALR
jgi:hypothetical protein